MRDHTTYPSIFFTYLYMLMTQAEVRAKKTTTQVRARSSVHCLAEGVGLIVMQREGSGGAATVAFLPPPPAWQRQSQSVRRRADWRLAGKQLDSGERRNHDWLDVRVHEV